MSSPIRLSFSLLSSFSAFLFIQFPPLFSYAFPFHLTSNFLSPLFPFSFPFLFFPFKKSGKSGCVKSVICQRFKKQGSSSWLKVTMSLILRNEYVPQFMSSLLNKRIWVFARRNVNAGFLTIQNARTQLVCLFFAFTNIFCFVNNCINNNIIVFVNKWLVSCKHSQNIKHMQ